MADSAASALTLPPDGRQSETALKVQRGVCTLLHRLDIAPVPEVTLKSGRRADLIAIDSGGIISIVEIKSSPADFHADHKWPDYRAYCDRLYFAIPLTMDPGLMPAEAGLIIADDYDAEIVRAAPEHKLPAARRKAVTLRVARVSAYRLLGRPDLSLGLPAI